MQRAASAIRMTGALTSQVGIVDLHDALKAALMLALAHHRKQLVLEAPGRGVAYPQHPLELQGAGAVLVLREQIDGQEPHRQRQLGVLKHRAHD